jgi:hypothetical protein
MRRKVVHGSLVQHAESSVMVSKKKIALFIRKKDHSQQISLEKLHARTQTLTKSGEEVRCGFSRGLKRSDQAELAYPP